MGKNCSTFHFFLFKKKKKSSIPINNVFHNCQQTWFVLCYAKFLIILTLKQYCNIFSSIQVFLMAIDREADLKKHPFRLIRWRLCQFRRSLSYSCLQVVGLAGKVSSCPASCPPRTGMRMRWSLQSLLDRRKTSLSMALHSKTGDACRQFKASQEQGVLVGHQPPKERELC